MNGVISKTPSPLIRTIAVLVGWLLPGAGLWVIGQKTRGTIAVLTIAATFWMGVAVGGVRNSIDPEKNRAWFAAHVFCGGHTLAVLAIRENVPDRLPYIINWPSANIGIVYCGVSGLLNVLTLLHVVAWPALADEPRPSRKHESEGAS